MTNAKGRTQRQVTALRNIIVWSTMRRKRQLESWQYWDYMFDTLLNLNMHGELSEELISTMTENADRAEGSKRPAILV